MRLILGTLLLTIVACEQLEETIAPGAGEILEIQLVKKGEPLVFYGDTSVVINYNIKVLPSRRSAEMSIEIDSLNPPKDWALEVAFNDTLYYMNRIFIGEYNRAKNQTLKSPFYPEVKEGKNNVFIRFKKFYDERGWVITNQRSIEPAYVKISKFILHLSE